MDPAHEAAVDGVVVSASNDPERPGDEYRFAVERVEALEQNQPGADKTWVEQSLREYRAHYSRTSRVR